LLNYFLQALYLLNLFFLPSCLHPHILIEVVREFLNRASLAHFNQELQFVARFVHLFKLGNKTLQLDVLFHNQLLFLHQCYPVIILILHGAFVHLNFGVHGLILAFEFGYFFLLLFTLSFETFCFFVHLPVLLVQTHYLHLQLLLLVD
jgi:hypothetical protein